MDRRRAGIVIGLMGIAALVVPCAAGDEDELIERPLDSGVSDRGPLSTSLRESRIDFRKPLGFERVYDLPGDDDRLLRVSGALYATFPRSYYSRTKRGTMPVIPNDTVFHIGPPLELLDDSPPPPPRVADGFGRGRVETRLEIDPTGETMLISTAMRTRPRPLPAPAETRWRRPERTPAPLVATIAPVTPIIVPIMEEEETPLPQTVVTDAAYRRSRVRTLLERAASAAGGGNED
jgi:hypothetical protein